MKRIWVLGAPDTEMVFVEMLLRQQNETVVFARGNGPGGRTTPGGAYAVTADLPWPLTGDVILVECDLVPEQRDEVIDQLSAIGAHLLRADHHRPGDPGYGQGPENYATASSIGQVAALLGVDLTPRQRLVAAADHCLGAAYRGQCPGVDPEDLMVLRTTQRAAFQRRPVEEVLGDIRATAEALWRAPQIEVGSVVPEAHDHNVDGPVVDGTRTCTLCDGTVSVSDMRRSDEEGGPWPELPEAATRLGVGYMSGPLRTPEGRMKLTCSGSLDQVRLWMRWATAQGLVDIYGDPARGFAGGYLP